MSLIPRRFQGEEDISKIKEFLRGQQYWDRLPDYWNIGQSTLGIYLTLWSTRFDHLLWADQNGEVRGYTWLSFEENRRFGGQSQEWRILTHPQHRQANLAEEMLLQAENQLRSQSGMNTPDDPLKTVAYETDASWISFIQTHGYVQKNHLEVYLRRSISQEIPEPDIADGYEIRGFKGEIEIEQRAGAQHESFGGPSEPDDQSISDARQFIRWYEGREDIDLVAVSSSATIASYAVSLIDPATKIGEFDPVGTRPSYRRLGLSRALMLTGLQYMKDKGMTNAVVRTDADNYPAISLYESVGFEIADKLYRYVKRF